MDASYGLYNVVDRTFAVVGVEVVIHSLEGEKAFGSFLDPGARLETGCGVLETLWP